MYQSILRGTILTLTAALVALSAPAQNNGPWTDRLKLNPIDALRYE